MSGHEHEFEAARGLPEALPPGERLLWQGAPAWQAVARRAFHAGSVAVYFFVLLLWRVTAGVLNGETLRAIAGSLAWLVPLAATGLAILALLAWLTARTTVYTITDRRVVMRVGIVLSVTYNLPFRAIESAGVRAYADRTGDISIALGGEARISFLHLWPHVRPWRLVRAEPTLRGVADAAAVAELLSRAVAASDTGSVRQHARTAAAERPGRAALPLATAR